MSTLGLAIYNRGTLRHDFKDFSEKTYTIQVKYSTGWETIQSPSFAIVNQDWSEAKSRWRSLRLRLLDDGKVIRRS